MKYKCCGFIKHGIQFFYENKINLCSQLGHKGGGEICILDNITDKTFDIDKLIENRYKIYEKCLKGEEIENCEGCIDLKEEDNLPINQPKIKNLMIQHWTKCNSNCIYCYTGQDKKYFNSLKTYSVYPILKKMAERDIIDKNGLANFAGGEFTCLKEFNKIVKLLDKYNYFYVMNSSGVDYSSTIGKKLKQGKSSIVISVDAGSKEVHRKIKRVKTFDKVWRNIKKYNKNALYDDLVSVKYIVVPGYNDNEDEINKWLEKCIQVNVKNIVLDINAHYFRPNRDNISPHIIDLFYKTKDKVVNVMHCNFYVGNMASIMLTSNVSKYKDPVWDKYKYDEIRVVNRYFNIN